MSTNADMLQDDTRSTTTLKNLEDTEIENEEATDKVVNIESVRTQYMNADDFMNMLEQKCQQIFAIREEITKTEEGIKDYEETYADEMEIMKALDKEHELKDRELLKLNSLTQHHMEAYKGLKQDRQKVERLEGQKDTLQDNIKDMWEVADQLIREEGYDVPNSARQLEWLPTDQYDTEAEGEE